MSKPSPKLMPRPWLTKTHFDLPPTSLVTVWKMNGTQVTGQVYANPKYTSNPSCLELVNVMYDKINQVDMVGKRLAFMTIHENDIKNMQVLQRAERVDREMVNPENVFKTERIVQSYNIYYLDQLKHYVHALQLFKVEKMALALKGINLSRDGTLGWMCCLTEQMLLVCIDCKGKKRDSANREWWNIIDEEILSNDKIMKIVFDVRPMIDFLFHRLSLDIVNVFDVQMTDLFQQVRNQNAAAAVGTAGAPVIKPKLFSELIENSSVEVLPQELTLVKAVEVQDYSLRHPLMHRPLIQCMEMKEVAVSLRLLLALYKYQMDLYTSPLRQLADAQINQMKNGSFLVSYEQAIQAGNYSGEIYQLMKDKMSEFYSLIPRSKQKQPNSAKNK